MRIAESARGCDERCHVHKRAREASPGLQKTWCFSTIHFHLEVLGIYSIQLSRNDVPMEAKGTSMIILWQGNRRKKEYRQKASMAKISPAEFQVVVPFGVEYS